MKVILDMIDEGCNCTQWCDAHRNHQKSHTEYPVIQMNLITRNADISDVEKDQLFLRNEKELRA